MYEKIKKWYSYGIWTNNMVNMAAQKGVISKEQADEIIGTNLLVR